MLSLLIACLLPLQDSATQHGEPPVTAPFERLDTFCVNDWWNRKRCPIVDLQVPRDQVVSFAVYTIDRGTLKLSAQLYPLYPDETRTVRLELRDSEDTPWREVQQATVNDLGWSALFRLDEWDGSRSVEYRVRHGEAASFRGTLRSLPSEKSEILVAGLSCNSNQDRGSRANIVANLLHQDPDLLFFAGDQSYDHREHTAAWLLFGQQFRELLRDRPCITIPDDHDVGQGNLWGENGKVAKLGGGADGGYKFDAEYVRMVERCQTAHLPDAYDPTPIEQGIGVYYTSMAFGWLDLAILEDRKFKSGPAGKIPKQGPRPDHINDPGYDPATIDLPGLTLLGERQLKFLEAWGQAPREGRMRAVLSQTGFCGAAHIHGKIDNRLFADLDSNGWPQTGRRKALELIRAAGAVHIGGDQHLATVVQHGLDEHRDGPYAFIVPAIVNNYYSRWWWPEDEQAGAQASEGAALPWTGDYYDGFRNPITLMAYANPESRDRGSGYGLIRFRRATGEVTFECWPRKIDVTKPDARPFPGWPVTVKPGP